MKKFQMTVNGQKVEAQGGETVLQTCQRNKIDIPVMCAFDGLTNVGACRMCLVEVEGSTKLQPACTMPSTPNLVLKTNTERLVKYRQMTVELFFSERNHICSVCVANNNCELQNLGYSVGMTHVRFPYLNQSCEVDGSHEKFIIDHNRCIMCTRCVRVCDEVEGAHNWDIKNRGFNVRIISDFDQPWGESTTCTSCGKCIQICPTGALWPKNTSIGRLSRDPAAIKELIQKKGASK